MVKMVRLFAIQTIKNWLDSPHSPNFSGVPGDRAGDLRKTLQIITKGVFIVAKVSKETKIKKETKRLMEVFKDLEPNKLKTVDALIARAAYITVTLQELEEQLNAEGWVEEYNNGRLQSGMKKSAKAEVHISLTKNLNAIMKQLLDLVPPAQKASRLEEMFGA